MRTAIKTEKELYKRMRMEASATVSEIVDCFSDVAEYIINKCLIAISDECYRVRAVEFYYFNPQHRDFFTCLLEERHCSTFWEKSPYGILVEFGNNFPLYYKLQYGFPWSYMRRLMEDTSFGYAVITDLDSDISLKDLLKNADRHCECRQDLTLSPVEIVRNIRKSELVQFDDVYDCVNKVRQRVKAGIYSREEIAKALLHFQRQRYRFEVYKGK